MNEDLVVRAERRLRLIDDRRTALRLHKEGASIAQIATALGTDEVRAARHVRIAERTGVDETPGEIILRAYVDGSSRGDLVFRLARWNYTFREYDGSVPGTWDDVLVACLSGYITDDEFAQICQAVQPPPGG